MVPVGFAEAETVVNLLNNPGHVVVKREKCLKREKGVLIF